MEEREQNELVALRDDLRRSEKRNRELERQLEIALETTAAKHAQVEALETKLRDIRQQADEILTESIVLAAA